MPGFGDDGRPPGRTVAVVQTCRCATPSRRRLPAGYRQNRSSATSSPIGGRSPADGGVRASIVPSFPAAQRAETSLASLLFFVPVFDPGQVGQDRSGLDPARLVVASLTGAARRHAGWEEPTES